MRSWLINEVKLYPFFVLGTSFRESTTCQERQLMLFSCSKAQTSKHAYLKLTNLLTFCLFGWFIYLLWIFLSLFCFSLWQIYSFGSLVPLRSYLAFPRSRSFFSGDSLLCFVFDWIGDSFSLKLCDFHRIKLPVASICQGFLKTCFQILQQFSCCVRLPRVL